MMNVIQKQLNTIILLAKIVSKKRFLTLTLIYAALVALVAWGTVLGADAQLRGTQFEMQEELGIKTVECAFTQPSFSHPECEKQIRQVIEKTDSFIVAENVLDPVIGATKNLQSFTPLHSLLSGIRIAVTNLGIIMLILLLNPLFSAHREVNPAEQIRVYLTNIKYQYVKIIVHLAYLFFYTLLGAFIWYITGNLAKTQIPTYHVSVTVNTAYPLLLAVLTIPIVASLITLVTGLFKENLLGTYASLGILVLFQITSLIPTSQYWHPISWFAAALHLQNSSAITDLRDYNLIFITPAVSPATGIILFTLFTGGIYYLSYRYQQRRV